MTKPVILIDASSYFYRAFHALPPLNNSKGQPTGAIFGVANMIKRLIKDYQPTHLAVIFDAKGKTFRDDWYPEYKAHRAPTPPDLSRQFEPLVEILGAMGLPLLIIDGVEADDVIGTLARMATEQQLPVVISTGDKDMAQLVNEHVTLINTMSSTKMDIDGVKEKFGVYPEQIVDYLTLIGDTVDNVPGVSKCGPKTAVKWLEQHLTLDNVITHAQEVSGKIGENLRESLHYLPLSKRLVTIKTDVTLPCSLQELFINPPQNDLLIKMTRELEFKTWLRELLEQSTPAQPEKAEVEQNLFTIINSPHTFSKLLDSLNADAPLLGLELKTTSPDPLQAEIVGLALAVNSYESFYIPLLHQEDNNQLSSADVLGALKPIFENEKINKLGQNLKYHYQVLRKHNIDLKGIAFDTMLESYILNSSVVKHDIDSLTLKYLGHKIITLEEVAGKGAKQRRFDEISVDSAAAYAAGNINAIMKLHDILHPALDNSLKTVLQNIEIPLLSVLADIEYKGVLINIDTLNQHGQRLKIRMNALEKEALELAGRPFNLNSPKQLQEILFDEQKLPVISKTPSGQPSTAEAVLQELAENYRLPAVILQYRSLNKLVSTYIDALPKRVNAQTGRVHTSYNQAVAATGRLSSSEPNLQNIPVRTEEGRLIRTTFIAPAQHLILAADYSQIELRIMAHLSQDENLLKAFTMGWDIHTATASEIFQLEREEVTTEHRRRAKAVNFGLIYGMSAFGLARQLGIERQDAQRYLELYFERYPGVWNFMEQTRALARQQGYVETVFGRRLYVPEINTSNMMRRKAAERMAINAPMQGTAADIIKKAMLAVAAWQKKSSSPAAEMIMQVHDELVFEVREEAVVAVTAEVKHLMENAVHLTVPLEVSIGLGLNWDEAH